MKSASDSTEGERASCRAILGRATTNASNPLQEISIEIALTSMPEKQICGRRCSRGLAAAAKNDNLRSVEHLVVRSQPDLASVLNSISRQFRCRFVRIKLDFSSKNISVTLAHRFFKFLTPKWAKHRSIESFSKMGSCVNLIKLVNLLTEVH